jgi:alpha-mannosidase
MGEPEHSGYAFVASQAQQFHWLSRDAPELYDRLKAAVKRGTFVPVGGSWVEMDANVPSGEAIVRQLLYGQRYFQKEFGVKSDVFWLPDTFGYAAQFPQLIKGAGMSYFMTQKLSWSLINKFPHSSFHWKGLDGTQVLTHFPPADTYNAKVNVEEVVASMSANKDSDRAPVSMLLYGNGDGGGGPTRDMLSRCDILGDIDGLPLLKQSTPTQFFQELEACDAERPLCVWDGELYLELHQGTLTTQAHEKKFNRMCEAMMHALEAGAVMWWHGEHGVSRHDVPCPTVAMPWTADGTPIASPTTVAGPCGCDVTTRPLHELLHPDHMKRHFWEDILLCQFHDVLPGSSIGIVHRDSYAIRMRVMADAAALLFRLACVSLGAPASSCLTGSFDGIVANESSLSVGEGTVTGWNYSGVARSEYVTIPSHWVSDCLQTTWDGHALVRVTAPAYGRCEVATTLHGITEDDRVTLAHVDGGIEVKNSHIRVTVDALTGRVSRLVYLPSNREVISPSAPGNAFMMYDDIPLYWDAWDIMPYALETGKNTLHDVKVAVLESGPFRAVVCVEGRVGESSVLKQYIIVYGGDPTVHFHCTVDWHEAYKLLKVEFPVNVRAADASFETQFGWLRRSTTTNTSWDAAKHEVCGHRWADLSEAGFGVALLNDSKYGYCCRDSTLAMSLIRSPKSPDDICDMGMHEFRFALLPHEAAFPVASVVTAGITFNSPLSLHALAHPVTSCAIESSYTVTSATSGCLPVLDTLKLSEDSGDVVIVRCYEALGGRGQCTLTSTLPIVSCVCLNLLEEPVIGAESTCVIEGSRVTFPILPFQVVTLGVRVK